MDAVEQINSALYTGYFFGLTVYNFDLRLNKQLLWYSMLLILILVSYWPAELYLAFDSDVFSIAHWVDVALLSLTYFIAVYKSIRNVKLLKELAKYLSRADYTSSLNTLMKKSYMLPFCIVIVIIISLIDALTAEEKLRFWEYVPLLFTLSLEDQFRQMVLMLSMRLDALLPLIGKSDPVKLVQSYNYLYKASKIINQMYSLQVLASIISVFSFIMSEAYLLAEAYLSFTHANDDSKIDVIIYSSNFLFRFLQMFLMCQAGSSILNKIATTTAVYVVIIIQFDMSCSCTISNNYTRYFVNE